MSCLYGVTHICGCGATLLLLWLLLLLLLLLLQHEVHLTKAQHTQQHGTSCC
jgi:hypothetical protein